MPPELTGRLDFWNIGYPLGALVYLTAPIALAAIAWALWQRSRYWRLGKPNPDAGTWRMRLGAGLRTLLVDSAGHRRFVRNERYPGTMHFLIFWGIVILFIATSLDAIEFNSEKYLGWHLPSRNVGLQLELIWDIGGVMLIAGIGLAAWRRYIVRPPRLNTMLENNVLLALLLASALSGFVLQSLRMAATELEPSSDLYSVASAYWSPFSYVIAVGIRGIGFTVYAMEVSHFALWWAHAGLMSATFVYAAWRFGPLMHIFVSPLNLVMRSSVTRPKGALRPMGDLGTLEVFGASEITQLTSKQLLDFDACTNCGRCQDQCPAWRSGKPLSPRKLVQDAKAYMESRAPVLLALGPDAEPPPPEADLVHGAISTDVLWACTTCRACMEACPAFVEHIDSIVDMRRFLTMEEADVPEEAMNALTSMEQRGHPWRGTQATRTDWMEGADAVPMSEDPEHDVLLWVGCTAALDGRGQQVARAMASVLKLAGVQVPGARQRGDVHGRPGPPDGERVPLPDDGGAEHRDAEGLRGAEDRDALPALLQHAEERVPAVRRRVRGDPLHRVRGGADPRRAHPSCQSGPALGGLPRLVLPGAPQRHLRGAAGDSAGHPRPAARRDGRGALPRARASAAARAAGGCGWRSKAPGSTTSAPTTSWTPARTPSGCPARSASR